MEKERGMPWLAFLGCILVVVSLVLVLVLSFVFGSSNAYRAQPLADVAGIVVLIVGLVLIYAGLRKKGTKV